MGTTPEAKSPVTDVGMSRSVAPVLILVSDALVTFEKL